MRLRGELRRDGRVSWGDIDKLLPPPSGKPFESGNIVLYQPDAELKARRADWQAPPPAFDTGWLQQYRRNVSPLSKGAVLVRTERPEPSG